MRMKSLAVATMLSAASLSAQSPVLGTVTFKGDIGNNGSVGGSPVGPYKADLTGYNAQFGLPAAPATLADYIVWCVDKSHLVSNSADSYYSTAFSSNTGGIIGDGDFSQTRQNNEFKYQQAAWLIEQYSASSPIFNAVNIQGTIWSLMGSSVTGFTDLTGYIPVGFTLTRDWYVLSDAAVPGTNDNETKHQELIASVVRRPVPEPSTIILLAGGIATLCIVRRRKSVA